MTHQVLARKWRPRDFETLVGQQHVVRALTHALASGRLHHAYLLTGTRGVGKTTIARILARAVNCETGVTARPCGQCSACGGIDAGRFVDYIELDAASNRGVDEMTQLLENAVYAPSAGRYKVYVIDEVHMLSTHAFNAMLKTLEEPPPHVLFILATTDPQKVPVTVLSRCLQFNLKNMTPAAIASHLAEVLDAERIAYDAPALALIGRSAGGSMRDALSLLDQAIAYGGGSVAEGAVGEMLGSVDQGRIDALFDALANADGAALIGVADAIAEAGSSFERVLDELALRLHRVALVQAGVRVDEASLEACERHARQFAPEDVQVYYQIVIHGARDLPLAPDPHAGFSMTLLRLLAFRPEGGGSEPPVPAAGGGARSSPDKPVGVPRSPGTATGTQALQALRAATSSRPARGTTTPGAMREASAPAEASDRRQPAASPEVAPSGANPPRGLRVDAELAPAVPNTNSRAELAPAMPEASPASHPSSEGMGSGAAPGGGAPVFFDGDWPALARRLAATGLLGQFLQQSELLSFDQDGFRVRVPIRPLAEAGTVARVRDVLSQHFGQPIRLQVEVGAVAGVTAARVVEQERGERLEAARESLESDPFVRSLLSDLGGRILPDSVLPVPGGAG
ncbi:MAG: DNA polymerase III subunit gamma/tau [Betaproteobacteria bacterium]|nr:DNA polymerase III subunit gamma/tau [Betaproteobacteria bacterium]